MHLGINVRNSAYNCGSMEVMLYSISSIIIISFIFNNLLLVLLYNIYFILYKKLLLYLECSY